ncbi:hypothetical protein [Paludisphaera borealis]|uniref:Carboxypeptidase regulatory-like domain-containing protein n=1 Tax=Paludisphaera borealis TaxID=1387353 RepID=A0A1U7CYT3_9BACT|nr:hypothetical protein [Paludisphaera borealis]APW64120.1 hypothetical protein BSF38_05712 [Paludisphaera borealis]
MKESPLPTPRRWIRSAATSVVAGLLVTAVGCGGPESCLVSGKVLVDDRPAEGVYVVFHTAGDSTGLPDSGSARSGDDGSFTVVVSTPGESTVTAFWPTVTVKDQDTIEGVDRFGGAYRDPRRPVATVTIHEGENAVPPIKLTSPPRGKSRTSSRR